jgi:hypothetical protein
VPDGFQIFHEKNMMKGPETEKQGMIRHTANCESDCLTFHQLMIGGATFQSEFIATGKREGKRLTECELKSSFWPYSDVKFLPIDTIGALDSSKAVSTAANLHVRRIAASVQTVTPFSFSANERLSYHCETSGRTVHVVARLTVIRTSSQHKRVDRHQTIGIHSQLQR